MRTHGTAHQPTWTPEDRIVVTLAAFPGIEPRGRYAVREVDLSTDGRGKHMADRVRMRRRRIIVDNQRRQLSSSDLLSV
jgi:hypothetical protein